MIQRDVWLVVEGWKGEHEGDYVSNVVCVCVWHEFRICQNQNGFVSSLRGENPPEALTARRRSHGRLCDGEINKCSRGAWSQKKFQTRQIKLKVQK